MESVCTVDLRERICGGNPSTSGEITPGENECGEVEPLEDEEAK
jgi:hypothetical protein